MTMEMIRHPGEDLFFEALLSLRTPQECKLFFEDVCTIKELQAMIHKAVPMANVSIQSCRGLCSYYAEKGGMLVGFEKM